MDDVLKLFVVLFLKSSDAVKQTLMKDLVDIFQLLK